MMGSSARAGAYELAGWLRGAPVAVTEGVSTGLPIPATAEVVLEGEMLGSAPGQQSGEPTVKVDGMLFRSDPIVIGCPPFPKATHGVLSSNAALIWNDLEALGIPNIVAVNHYGWGCTILAVKQPYPGHVKRTAHAVLGSFAGCSSRVVIVVDEDIDPFNLEKVFWAIATRYEPEYALDIVRRTWSDGIGPREIKDNKAPTGVTGSSAIIDACRPYHWMDKFPRTTDISDELLQKTAEKWARVLNRQG
jgi:4-hydroxy-3-polyprenylbenzoate decarboxylase